jgi:hypothetical protein
VVDIFFGHEFLAFSLTSPPHRHALASILDDYCHCSHRIMLGFAIPAGNGQLSL